MSIRNKILISVAPAIIICLAISLISDRMTAKREMRRMLRSSLNDLAVSAAELIRLVPPDRAKDLIVALNKKIKIGQTGFLFVTDSRGKMVIHKKVQGKNWIKKPHIKRIVEMKNGYHRYISPKTGTHKIAAFHYIPEKDWIVVASYFEDDALLKPLTNMLCNSALLLFPALAIIIAAFLWLTNRTVVRPLMELADALDDQSDQVARSSDSVAQAGQYLADNSSRQAAALEETVASLEQMAVMTKHNSENAGKANDLMNLTGQVVAQANEVMSDLTGAMDDIQAAGDEMSRVIKNIDEIAFQTNLLALNAAVEAARAGEHGTSFAVVADEVRGLAARATEAARNTAVMLEGTIQKAHRGGELVGQGDEAFSRVTQGNREATELVGQISIASAEQAEGIGQVNQAAAQVDQVTQQMAANAQESASASEELRNQADKMKTVVVQLRVMAGRADRPD